MKLAERNNKLGLSTVIIGYFTLIFYILTIYVNIYSRFYFLGINRAITIGYIFAGFLLVLILTSGVLFVLSLFFNIKETKSVHKLTKGIKLTLISIPPFFYATLQ